MPRTPPSRCTTPRCGRFATNNSHCDQHQPTGWTEYRRINGSQSATQRRGIKQQTWDKLKKQTNTEHNNICHWCGKPGANQIDHVQAVALGGAPTDPTNLAPIHEFPCHQDKTNQELTELRNRKNGKGKPYFQPRPRTRGPQEPLSRPQKTEPTHTPGRI